MASWSVLLLVNGFSAYNKALRELVIGVSLRNTKVEVLPANTTSIY